MSDNLSNDIPSLEYSINRMKIEVDNNTFKPENNQSLKDSYPRLYSMILASKGVELSPILKQMISKLRDLQQNKVSKFDSDVSIERIVAKDYWNPNIPREDMDRAH